MASAFELVALRRSAGKCAPSLPFLSHSVRLTDLDWMFVTTGLPDAVTAARERAEAASDSGKDLDVVLMAAAPRSARRSVPGG
jgi:hypothetical protein